MLLTHVEDYKTWPQIITGPFIHTVCHVTLCGPSILRLGLAMQLALAIGMSADMIQVETWKAPYLIGLAPF